MRIALDYDFTYKLDPTYWDSFIADARAQFHQVVIISSGRASDGQQMLTDLHGKVDDFIFTNGAPQKYYIVYRDGRHIDVWINANPEAIVCSAQPVS